MVLRAVWVGGGCFTGAAKATQGYIRRFFLLKKEDKYKNVSPIPWRARLGKKQRLPAVFRSFGNAARQ